MKVFFGNAEKVKYTTVDEAPIGVWFYNEKFCRYGIKTHTGDSTKLYIMWIWELVKNEDGTVPIGTNHDSQIPEPVKLMPPGFSITITND